MRRLFLGVSLPDSYRELLAALEKRWSGRLQSRLRWTTPENWHMTLVFLGAVDSGEEEKIISALAGVRFFPFFLRGQGVGFFPRKGKPRVVWLGVQGDVSRLSALKDGIDTALARAGRADESRPFVPHLTLARVKDARRDPWDDLRDDVLGVSWARFSVNEFVLWESVLHPDGARHMIRKVFPAMDVRDESSHGGREKCRTGRG